MLNIVKFRTILLKRFNKGDDSMIFADLELPIVYIIMGFYLLFFTPPRGWGIGYRTKRSKKSKESWIYANRLLGELLITITTTMILIMVITTTVFKQYNYLLSSIYFVINISIFIIVSLIVESKLKSKFDKEDVT